MIVQACLNGARPQDYHWAIPLTASDMARHGAACVSRGAAELHIHPRSSIDRESLSAVKETMRAVRLACPGTLVGVSTGAWIEGDVDRTRQCIARWKDLPDYASVNLSERDAPAIIEVLHSIGVGVEAGLASVDDAKRFVAHPNRSRVFRVLIEIDEQDFRKACETADDIAAVLVEAGVRRPMLLHGHDATVWPFVKLARERRWSTRVGLEDGKELPNGAIALDNATLVAAAISIYRAW